ncbi:MAG: hypothetical protein VB098_11570 [Petrimonas sp.]|nr:hypothetical protein [Petrimonas sp.]MEA5062028.1 hypothetical protein [Petrimonas sp.]
MNRFLKTKLFDLLSCSIREQDGIYYTDLSNAYDDFVGQLLDFCREEQDIILLCFTINYTMTELKGLNIQLEIKPDSKATDLHVFFMKILDILESTYRIIKFRLENPEFFQKNKEDSFVSDVYLADDVDFIDIMEVICGLFYSHSVRNKTGNPVNFSDLTRVFETGMNFKFADIYKKRDDVFRRKAAKLTEFLNELIIAIKIESKNRGYR